MKPSRSTNATHRTKPRISPGITLPPTLDQLRDGGAAADIFRRPIAPSPSPTLRRAKTLHHAAQRHRSHPGPRPPGSDSKLQGPRELTQGGAGADRARDRRGCPPRRRRDRWEFPRVAGRAVRFNSFSLPLFALLAPVGLFGG
jgi:hypothetical protein